MNLLNTYANNQMRIELIFMNDEYIVKVTGRKKPLYKTFYSDHEEANNYFYELVNEQNRILEELINSYQ
jgi:parvulin-like peptidyl-prolyl isomerase